jgi:Zn-dependent protease
MLATLRAGRVGPLTIYLNYTWFFALALITWWVALFRLPADFPDWSPAWNWVTSIAVALLFLASVVAHELVHTLVARTGRRNVNLYPFGAAVPFRLRHVGARRVLASVAAALGLNLLLGGSLLWLGSAIPASGHPLSWLGAILVPLGTLNLLLAIANLIPGIPFDGGWALTALGYLLSNDKETGLAFARRLGWLAALVLVFIGVWQGLTGQLWPQALGFVLLGWAAAEADMVGQQRSTLRELFTEMTAGDFMEAASKTAPLHEDATVSEMVRAYHGLLPNKPLPVVDADGTLVGVTSLGKAETLLQGTWPTTPVRAIALSRAQAQAVSADTPLVEVLALVEANPGAREELPDIPVIEANRLVGSINPDKLQSFEEAGRQFGLQEALGANTEKKRGGRLGRLGTLVPVALVLLMAVVLGNGVLNADDDTAGEADAGPETAMVFSNFVPSEGQIIGLGETTFSVQIQVASPILTTTIEVDGVALDTQLSGQSPLTQTASATSPGLTLGPHTARVTAHTESGQQGTKQWQFRVVPGGAAPPTAAPTTPPGGGAITVLTQEPSLGARVPAGSESVVVQISFEGMQPQSANITLDEQVLDAGISPVEGAGEQYRVSATVPQVQAGLHKVDVVITAGEGSRYSYQWTFTALQPDANNAYFSQTGYFVSQPFLSYWQDNGGLALFGLPISDLLQERDEVTGETYTAQYFERARFEMHPSLGNQVILGRLGALVVQPEEAAQPRPGAQFFAETGHNLSDSFLQYWNDHGGLAVFGYPITEPRVEKNPVDGKEYMVQYFERARFELHPDMAGTPFEVQLGLLGVQVFDRLYSER